MALASQEVNNRMVLEMSTILEMLLKGKVILEILFFVVVQNRKFYRVNNMRNFVTRLGTSEILL